MNGGQDLGGMQGFGPVIESLEAEANDPLYHGDWEKRVMAMVVALGACGKWNIDLSRHARESLSPGEYLTSSYYNIWLKGVTKLLLERDMVTKEELQDGTMHTPPQPVRGCLSADKVWDTLHSLGGAANRAVIREAQFSPGDSVRTINIHPVGHTRLPRYARAKTTCLTAMSEPTQQ